MYLDIIKFVKRGPKPRRKVLIKWTPNFAYAIGLIATDGCLSKKGGVIDFTSKDIEQLENFKKCLNLDSKIGLKKSKAGFLSNRIQFRDQFFHKFLQEIGLNSAKSKVLGELKIPKKYFFDFLRGSFDGDGTFYSYWDKRWKSSFMFYTEFISASEKHISWIRDYVFKEVGIMGHVTRNNTNICKQLKYAKKDSLKILRKMYYSNDLICLSRKRLKINKVLDMIGEKTL